MTIVGGRSNPAFGRCTDTGLWRLWRGQWRLTCWLYFKNSAMLIADECAERAQVLTVHFIDMTGFIGHHFAHASQVHPLAIKPALPRCRLRLGRRQHVVGRGGKWCRNWYRLWERRVRQRRWVRQHGGLFDAY